MKIVCVSDTHGYFPLIPKCDLLIHAGDLTNQGTENEVRRGLEWLSGCASEVILVPGNHDVLFQRDYSTAYKMARDVGVKVLIDQEVIVNGLLVYGSPWQPWFLDWAFNAPRAEVIGDEFMQEKWAQIPVDTDILVTHVPPYGTGDLVGGISTAGGGRHIGCPALEARLPDLLPALRLHVFGHCHSGYGVYQKWGRLAVNASICDEGYNQANAPITVHL